MPEPTTGVPAAQTIDDLPEWARDEIKSLRKEAGGYRTRATEAEQALAAAQTAATAFETQISDLESTRTALEADKARIQLAIDRGLPLTVKDAAGESVSVTSLIVGQTDDERAASANALVALLGSGADSVPPDPAQSAAPAVDSRADLANAFFTAAGAE
ncbi:hypothetical protein [Nocardia brasiliensis]|uniref:hypothetical protein n=1 Tax=Nocardia brasiliensis TaxID=37326 RepID=UPI0024551E24|nr:hypothetical protein [Nocardia brasiliensis]